MSCIEQRLSKEQAGKKAELWVLRPGIAEETHLPSWLEACVLHREATSWRPWIQFYAKKLYILTSSLCWTPRINNYFYWYGVATKYLPAAHFPTAETLSPSTSSSSFFSPSWDLHEIHEKGINIYRFRHGDGGRGDLLFLEFIKVVS